MFKVKETIVIVVVVVEYNHAAKPNICTNNLSTLKQSLIYNKSME